MILRQSIRTLYSYAAARSFVLRRCLKFRHETCKAVQYPGTVYLGTHTGVLYCG